MLLPAPLGLPWLLLFCCLLSYHRICTLYCFCRCRAHAAPTLLHLDNFVLMPGSWAGSCGAAAQLLLPLLLPLLLSLLAVHALCSALLHALFPLLQCLCRKRV